MTEVERILDQYDRAMNGDAWHGDPVWKILDGISAEQAACRAEIEYPHHLGVGFAHDVLGD